MYIVKPDPGTDLDLDGIFVETQPNHVHMGTGHSWWGRQFLGREPRRFWEIMVFIQPVDGGFSLWITAEQDNIRVPGMFPQWGILEPFPTVEAAQAWAIETIGYLKTRKAGQYYGKVCSLLYLNKYDRLIEDGVTYEYDGVLFAKTKQEPHIVQRTVERYWTPGPHNGWLLVIDTDTDTLNYIDEKRVVQQSWPIIKRDYERKSLLDEYNGSRKL